MHKVNYPRNTMRNPLRMPRKALVQAIAALTITSAVLPVSTAVRADELERPGLLQRYTVNIQDLVIKGLEFVGVPYRRGGNTVESGFDCSGFVRAMYEQTVGLMLPRKAEQQAAATEKIDVNDLQPGDLVFFNTMKRAFSHVGIYVGEGKFIHSPKPGAEVRVENMNMSYWERRFNGARRVALPAGPGSAQYQPLQNP